MKVVFDGNSGLLKQIVNTVANMKLAVTQQLLFYVGMRGNNSEPRFTASGAYLFRPNQSEPFRLSENASLTVINVRKIICYIICVFGVVTS